MYAGHAAANIMPVVASNRIGHEVQKDSEMTFYGSSFIADETGGLVAEADRETEGVITAEFDLDAIAQKRRGVGCFPGSKTGDVWYAPDAWMLKTDWIRKVLCGAANICLTCEGIVCRWQSRM